MNGTNRCLGLVSSIAFIMMAAFGSVSLATESPLELDWGDLIPESATTKQLASPTGTIQHGQISTPLAGKSTANVTGKFNGKTVRIPGYIVPLEFDGAKIKQFLLVPYVGACIHVPPPPANQLIYVTSDTPHELKGLFEPVYVTGMFGAAASSTQLADVGYVLSADNIEPFE